MQHIPLPCVIFRPDIGKHFFNKRVVRHWTGLPEGVVNAPGPSWFERHLDNVLNLWSALTCSSCWTGWLLWVLSNWNILFYSVLFHSILAVIVFSVNRGKRGNECPRDMAVPWGHGQQISSEGDARAVPTWCWGTADQQWKALTALQRLLAQHLPALNLAQTKHISCSWAPNLVFSFESQKELSFLPAFPFSCMQAFCLNDFFVVWAGSRMLGVGCQCLLPILLQDGNRKGASVVGVPSPPCAGFHFQKRQKLCLHAGHFCFMCSVAVLHLSVHAEQNAGSSRNSISFRRIVS